MLLRDSRFPINRLLLFCLLPLTLFAEPSDSVFVEQLLKKYVSTETEAGSLIVQIGKEYLGRPYTAGTLEVNALSEESLVVNTREVDCTTFVDQVLALTLAALNNETNYSSFCRRLRELRYRNGVIDGYTSRLHYFTDFAKENAGLFTFLPAKDDTCFPETIVSLSYMSSHPDSYLALKDNPEAVSRIQEVEERYTSFPVRYIPKKNVDNCSLLQEGDIVALLTTMEGLDVSHLGIVVEENGVLHLLHASSAAGKVVIDSRPIGEMLKSRKSCPGIRAIRLKQFNKQ